MKPLITDAPKGAFETMCNLIFAKDGWQQIRHGENGMPTTDFCLDLCAHFGCDDVRAYVSDDQESKDQLLCDCVFDGCPVASVYAALCGFGHVRDRLRMLEDQLEWRKTEDELPVGSDQVLCVVNGKHGNLTFQNAVTIGAYYPKEGWCLEAWPEWETPGVTHWMPLPKPPKEDGR